LTLTLLLSACTARAASEPTTTRTVSIDGTFDASVVRVVDGDTFVARRAGVAATIRVRVIGVDTPETVKPHTPVQCGGAEASAFVKGLLGKGTRVRAAYERGGHTDRYGRDLWDVWLPDGRFLAGELVSTGTARAYRVRPQTQYADVLAVLDAQARRAHRGVWGPPCNGRSFGQ
jgi:micrococcal nuclease